MKKWWRLAKQLNHSIVLLHLSVEIGETKRSDTWFDNRISLLFVYKTVLGRKTDLLILQVLKIEKWHLNNTIELT